jgi:hypothetical protein
MTPDEQLYRDLWLAEMWAPVREYHPPKPPKATRRRRKAAPEPTQDQPRE